MTDADILAILPNREVEILPLGTTELGGELSQHWEDHGAGKKRKRPRNESADLMESEMNHKSPSQALEITEKRENQTRDNLMRRLKLLSRSGHFKCLQK